MRVIYTLEPINLGVDEPAIFLAGPTIRVVDGRQSYAMSWRRDAVKFLEEVNFKGVVICPEWKDDEKPDEWTYSRQVSWEIDGRSKAKVIAFWIPRNMNDLPGFTTNIEFGEDLKTGKCVVGSPPDTPHMRYIEERCTREIIVTCVSLKSLMEAAKIKAMDKGSKIWFTSDTHFGSQRTLEMSKRPFKSVEEMDWTMIKNWNERVSNKDTVYHLGDFGDWNKIGYLNFSKMLFLPGNYDRDKPYDVDIAINFNVLTSPAEIDLYDAMYTLVHEPEHATDPDDFYLFGHIHKLQMVKKNGLNVGVDCHNFYPIDTDTIRFYHTAITKYYDKNVFMPILGE